MKKEIFLLLIVMSFLLFCEYLFSQPLWIKGSVWMNNKDIIISHNNKYILIGDNNYTNIFDFNNCNLLKLIYHPSETCSFSTDDKTLYMLNYIFIEKINLETNEVIDTI